MWRVGLVKLKPLGVVWVEREPPTVIVKARGVSFSEWCWGASVFS